MKIFELLDQKTRTSLFVIWLFMVKTNRKSASATLSFLVHILSFGIEVLDHSVHREFFWRMRKHSTASPFPTFGQKNLEFQSALIGIVRCISRFVPNALDGFLLPVALALLPL